MQSSRKSNKIVSNGKGQSRISSYFKSFAKGFVGTLIGLLAIFAIIYFSALAVQADENRILNDFYMDEPYWADTSASSDISLSAYNAATGYRELLSDEHKKAYDDLEKAIRNMDFFCAFEPGTVAFEDVEMIYDSVLYDNPDILWCGATYVFAPDVTGHALGMFPIYLYDAPDAVRLHARLIEKVDEQYSLMEKALPEQMAKQANEKAVHHRDRIKAMLEWRKTNNDMNLVKDDQEQPERFFNVAMDNTGSYLIGMLGSLFMGSADNMDTEELEKELAEPVVDVTAEDMTPTLSDEIPYISNCVEQNLTYDHNKYDQTATAFADDSENPGKTVCVGYAKTYKLLCDRAGIECYLISGIQYGDPDSSHAWNMAYAEDGDVYFIDTTWADDDSKTESKTSIWCSSSGYYFEDSHTPNDFSCDLPIVIDGQAEPEIEKAKKDLADHRNRKTQPSFLNKKITFEKSFFKNIDEMTALIENISDIIDNMFPNVEEQKEQVQIY